MFPKPSARDRIRTDDTRFRRAVLYPLSYSGNDVSLYTATRPVASCSRGSLHKTHGSLCKLPGRTRHQGMGIAASHPAPRESHMEEPDIRSWPGLSCQFGANCSCARRKDTERQAAHGTVANRTKSKVTVNKPEERAAWQRHGVLPQVQAYELAPLPSHALPEPRHAQYPSLP